MNTEKLPPDFKAKWIAALRSGEYEQVRRHLCLDGKYCCLGVAARVCGIEQDILIANEVLEYHFTKGCEIPSLLLGDVLQNNIVHALVSMNDTQRLSFTEIADWIEENL
jgi:hypothetical protein